MTDSGYAEPRERSQMYSYHVKEVTYVAQAD